MHQSSDIFNHYFAILLNKYMYMSIFDCSEYNI